MKKLIFTFTIVIMSIFAIMITSQEAYAIPRLPYVENVKLLTQVTTIQSVDFINGNDYYDTTNTERYVSIIQIELNINSGISFMGAHLNSSFEPYTVFLSNEDFFIPFITVSSTSYDNYTTMNITYQNELNNYDIDTSIRNGLNISQHNYGYAYSDLSAPSVNYANLLKTQQTRYESDGIYKRYNDFGTSNNSIFIFATILTNSGDFISYSSQTQAFIVQRIRNSIYAFNGTQSQFESYLSSGNADIINQARGEGFQEGYIKGTQEALSDLDDIIEAERLEAFNDGLSAGRLEQHGTVWDIFIGAIGIADVFLGLEFFEGWTIGIFLMIPLALGLLFLFLKIFKKGG